MLYNSEAVKFHDFTGDFQKGVTFMAKDLQVALLLDYYGALLTDKQRDFISLYYDEDLSLSEIAENEGITRQGVRDSIKRCEQQLFDFEKKLGLFKRFGELEKGLDEIAATAEKIQTNSQDNNIKQLAQDIIRTAGALKE